MFSRATVILTVFYFLSLPFFASAAPHTFTGVVTDTMCGKKHMIAGKSDAECTRECMKSKGNWAYGLVVGDKVYKLAGDNQRLNVLAGQRVEVTGEVTGNNIAIQSITAARR